MLQCVHKKQNLPSIMVGSSNHTGNSTTFRLFLLTVVVHKSDSCHQTSSSHEPRRLTATFRLFAKGSQRGSGGSQGSSGGASNWTACRLEGRREDQSTKHGEGSKQSITAKRTSLALFVFVRGLQCMTPRYRGAMTMKCLRCQ